MHVLVPVGWQEPVFPVHCALMSFLGYVASFELTCYWDLVELDPNRTADEYVVPIEGLGSALSSKIVILQNIQTGITCTDTKS